jgi:hypothetical protein
MEPASSNFGSYVYCVGRADALTKEAFKSPALGNEGKIRIVRHQDIAAVVSDSHERRYAVSRRHLLAHERVIEEALDRSDVLPMRLGLVARDDGEVQKILLDRQYSALKRELDRVHDRVELGLKVSWIEERLFREISDEYPDCRAMTDETFDERMRRGERVAQAKAEKQEREAEAILSELQPVATEVVENEPVSEMMLLNAAFLVDRARLPKFDERVRKLGDREAGRLSFSYVGPLPPYNFVDASLTSEDEIGAPQ